MEISVLWLARVARRQGGAAVAAGLEQLPEAVHAGGYAVLADKVAVALTQGEVPGLLGAEARGPLRRPLRRAALRHTSTARCEQLQPSEERLVDRRLVGNTAPLV